MKLYDRFWWWCNRKPASKWSIYLSPMIVGFLSGIICFLGLVALSAKFWYVGSGIIVLGLGYAAYFYYSDKRNGYVDAYYEGYLKQRERIAKKLGKDV